MIIRISGEGQYRMADADLERLNALDAEVESALDDEEVEYADALAALLDLVRTAGEEVADEELVESDVILPGADASAAEVRAMLTGEGLIPG